MSGQQEPLKNQNWGENLVAKAILPLGIAITVANSLVLVIFLKKSFLVKKSTYLLVNLTVADLLVGFCGSVLVSILYPIFPSKPGIVVDIHWANFKLTTIASGLSLAAVSIERMIAVVWPLHHRLAKRLHYFTTIGIVWLLATFLSVTFTLNSTFNTVFTAHLYNYVLLTLEVSLLIIILASYLSIWIKLKFFNTFRRSRAMQENDRLSKTLFIVTLVSFAAWLPKSIERYLKYRLPGLDIPQQVSLGFTILVLFNSLVNIIVYSLRMPDFRKELKSLFSRCN